MEAFINNINQSFLEGEKIKYSPGFGFLQKYSTSSPIDLIDQIKKEIDKDKYLCRLSKGPCYCGSPLTIGNIRIPQC